MEQKETKETVKNGTFNLWTETNLNRQKKYLEQLKLNVYKKLEYLRYQIWNKKEWYKKCFETLKLKFPYTLVCSFNDYYRKSFLLGLYDVLFYPTLPQEGGGHGSPAPLATSLLVIVTSDGLREQQTWKIFWAQKMFRCCSEL